MVIRSASTWQGWQKSVRPLITGQHHGVAPQLINTHLKRNPGAGRGFLEDHAQALALKQVVFNAVFGLIFQLVCQIQYLNNLLAGHIQQL